MVKDDKKAKWTVMIYPIRKLWSQNGDNMIRMSLSDSITQHGRH